MKNLNTWIDTGEDTWILMSENDAELKRLLYLRFDGEKELVIRDNNGVELERLKLNELYNE
jgi:hypothetical protein